MAEQKKSGLSPLMMLPPIIFMGFAVMVYFGMQRGNTRELPSTFIGQPAPEITNVALDGYDGITREMLTSGDVTMVNFWASWCPPCRVEHPNLMKMQADGLRIVGVNFKDKTGQAQQFLNSGGNPFMAVGFDAPGRTAIDWGVTAPPETFILDGKGTVLFRYTGPLIGSDYEQRFLPELNRALDQAGS
ncbi:DsbE family thiol:disulfide interchange protein [Pelagimonas varians]|uniref:Thiol:disulfide interchange protein CycY n=1 Tax=Pelagimonas varians TaxID=696760 RepID=A0A238KDD3_9RHOB|nr:DsbE family thiol:disulfide interchange protein [Pelagimonas varians]PYG29909.1 cytochrome c biogenesis protein CcmG/thiol:disulfide interchange protein DsbE [Pelagimonas varians]SMX40793.1 Thiol:disulfide interchange protein CycY precursor [Pelagimonas varians]